MIEATAEVQITNLAILQNAIQGGMQEGLEQAGKFIVDLASQLAPEDTGELKASGEANWNGKDGVEISFGNGLPDDRAIAQEYGTMYMPAQPYLGPAIKAIDIVEEVAKAVRRRLV